MFEEAKTQSRERAGKYTKTTRETRESTTLEKDRGKPLEPSAKGIAERGIDFPSCYDVLIAWG